MNHKLSWFMFPDPIDKTNILSLRPWFWSRAVTLIRFVQG